MMGIATQMRSYGENSQGMDARIWGELQNHFDLGTVYAKLPIRDFFRLRLVCKEWNRLASDRGFLEDAFRDPIPKPYFVVGTWKMKHRLLTYDGFSRRWNWTRIPYAYCEVEGVYNVDYREGLRIFNVHTRVFYDPPRPPKPPSFPFSMSLVSDDDENDEPQEPWTPEPLLGITVDTSVRPYSFQVILGDEVIETRIYHSNRDSWTYNNSKLSVEYFEGTRNTSCTQCNGLLYIRVWGVPNGSGVDLYIYNPESKVWTFNSPSIPDDVWLFCDIGAWQDRLFFFGVKKSQSSCAIKAFELSNHSEDSWTLFDRMPDNLCSWMLAGQEGNFDGSSLGTMCMQSIFCGEHVLVYNCVGLEEVTERAILYNLDRKTWEIVELPGPLRLLWSEAGNDLTIRLRNAVQTTNVMRSRNTTREVLQEAISGTISITDSEEEVTFLPVRPEGHR